MKKIRVDKSDFARVLLTETSPDDVPIVFSNDGFYQHCIGNSSNDIIKNLVRFLIQEERPSTIPLPYQIRKDDNSVRSLSLIHPAYQFKFIKFYQDYYTLIPYHCNISPASLRAPEKVGAAFYIRNPGAYENELKQPSIETDRTDRLIRHPSSFFAYRGYRRLHSFFGSSEYLKLEQKYHSMWLLDVTKCFASHYTHSISWAVKSKPFIKEHKTVSATFGSEFDSIMQRLNHQETNGIIIGPEVSRIFSEIIFQDIDTNTIETLKVKDELKYGQQYVFKRYVDDIIVFAESEDVSSKVFDRLSDGLLKYNLHINPKKVNKFQRPFFTSKSALVKETKREIGLFFRKFTESRSKKIRGELRRILLPKNIYYPERLKLDFIESIKVLSIRDESDFELISGYIIGALFKRIKRLADDSEHAKKEKVGIELHYKAILLLLEIMYYFFSITPTVAASFNIAKAIIISRACMRKYYPEVEPSLNQYIIEFSLNILEPLNVQAEFRREHYVPLPKLNLMIALSELGENYLLPAKLIEKLFNTKNSERLGYFETMVALFYMKDYSIYEESKNHIIAHIDNKLSKLGDHKEKAEITYFFLDAVSCPFLPDDFKTRLVENLYRQLQLRQPNALTMRDALTYLKENPWFIQWANVNLYRLLEKKELTSTY